MLRTVTMLPATVADAGASVDAAVTEKPAGAVTFADPSCCGTASFVKRNEKTTVAPPMTGSALLTTAAYGFVVVAATPGVAGTRNSTTPTTT